MFCDFKDVDLQYQYQQAGGDPSQCEEAITDVLWSDPTTECLKPLSHGVVESVCHGQKLRDLWLI